MGNIAFDEESNKLCPVVSVKDPDTGDWIHIIINNMDAYAQHVATKVAAEMEKFKERKNMNLALVAALFVGGPLHGQFALIPDEKEWHIDAYEPRFGKYEINEELVAPIRDDVLAFKVIVYRRIWHSEFIDQKPQAVYEFVGIK